MSKIGMSLAFIALLFLGCASNQRQTAKSKDNQELQYQINWPENYNPNDATFFVHNQIEINAPAEYIWDILIQAEKWPDWYPGAFNVKVQNSTNGNLHEDSVFKWKTMGLNFVSTIKEFQAPYRLSWESKKSTINGYHAWLIIPTDEGSILITDESQHGFLAYMQIIFQPNKLRKLHDIWLLEIKNKAELAFLQKNNLIN